LVLGRNRSAGIQPDAGGPDPDPFRFPTFQYITRRQAAHLQHGRQSSRHAAAASFFSWSFGVRLITDAPGKGSVSLPLPL
jgi:hypothetical protein